MNEHLKLVCCIFQSFRSNLPPLIDEECVRQYHDFLDLLESAAEVKLDNFRIDSSKLSFRLLSSQAAGALIRSRIQYSNKRYCDAYYFETAVTQLEDFLNQCAERQDSVELTTDLDESSHHKEQFRKEIKEANERADALERIVPHISDPETRRKAEQEIESYRLHATRLCQHLRDRD